MHMCIYMYMCMCVYIYSSPDIRSACKFFSPLTTPKPGTFPGGVVDRRAAGGTGAGRPRAVSARSPGRSGATPSPGRAPGGARRAGEAPRRREGETPRDSRAARPCQPGVCAVRGLLPARTARRRARAAPGGLPRPAPGGHSPSPAGRAGRAPDPLLPAGTGPSRPCALPPRSGSGGASFGSGWLRGALCGAPQSPLYSALPASRSLSPFQRQPLVARSTCFLSGSWPALQRARGRRHPVPKPNQKYGM